MGQNSVQVFVHEFLVRRVNRHDDSSVLMFVLDCFSTLVPDFEHECFVLILGQLVLVSEDAFDNLAVERLVLADAFLDVHDDLPVSFLERFIFFCISDGSFTFGL